MRQKPQKREPFQNKKPKAGQKSQRNVPEIESETKDKATFALTKTAKANLKKLAKERGCSVSSLIEDIARERYMVVPRDVWEKVANSLESAGLDITQYLETKKREI